MRVQEVKKIFAIIFMFGFLIGILYVNLFAKEYIASMGMFNDYFLEQYSLTRVKTEDYMWYIVRIRMFPLILLGILGCTNFKKAAGSIWILWTGFSCGVIITTAVLKMNINGILLCLISIIPHFICYITAYSMVIFYLLTYPNTRWNSSKMVSLILFMLLGIISECYVNPVLMNIVINSL